MVIALVFVFLMLGRIMELGHEPGERSELMQMK
jgi:hypothetical protein